MPRVRTTKDTTIAFRVTPRIGELVAQVASSEGLNTSEWLRNLVIAELKRRGLLPMTTLSLEVEGKRGGEEIIAQTGVDRDPWDGCADRRGGSEGQYPGPVWLPRVW